MIWSSIINCVTIALELGKIAKNDETVEAKKAFDNATATLIKYVSPVSRILYSAFHNRLLAIRMGRKLNVKSVRI